MSSSDTSLDSKSQRIQDIRIQLSIIDIRSARPIRAILSNTASEEDKKYLANLELQASSLRKELNSLTKS